VLPYLREHGVPQPDIDAMLVTNPAAFWPADKQLRATASWRSAHNHLLSHLMRKQMASWSFGVS
jgi:hypothetical protein